MISQILNSEGSKELTFASTLSRSPNNSGSMGQVWNLKEYPFHFLNIAALYPCFIFSIYFVKYLSLLLLLLEHWKLNLESSLITLGQNSVPWYNIRCSVYAPCHRKTSPGITSKWKSNCIWDTNLSLCISPLSLRCAQNFNDKNRKHIFGFFLTFYNLLRKGIQQKTLESAQLKFQLSEQNSFCYYKELSKHINRWTNS